MDWLSAAIAARETFAIGEVTVTFEDDDAVLRGPGPASGSISVPSGPEALRLFLRAGDRGDYRAIASARGMRSGWAIRVPVGELSSYLDAIYPLAAVHIRMLADGSLRVVPLETVLARQTGRYEVVSRATAAQRDAIVASLCACCVREPAWTGQAVTGNAIPCPEACSALVALCREVVVDPSASEPGAAAGREPVAFADFENPGNPIVAAVREALRR